MARSTGTKALFGCLGLTVVGGVLMCGGLLVAVFVLPGMAVSYFVDDQPLAVQSIPWDPVAAGAVAGRICPELAAGTEVTVTGAEATQLLYAALPGGGEKPEAIRFDVDPEGDATLDLSINVSEAGQDPQYFNLHTRIGFAMEHGWFTQGRIDALKVGSMDLGGYVAGQDATAQFNQQLAQQRGKDPDVAALVDRFATLRTVPGGITFSQAPGSEAFPVCALAPPPVEAPPEVPAP